MTIQAGQSPPHYYYTKSEMKKNIQIKMLFEVIDVATGELIDSFVVKGSGENKDTTSSGFFMLVSAETKYRISYEETFGEIFAKVAERLRK